MLWGVVRLECKLPRFVNAVLSLIVSPPGSAPRPSVVASETSVRSPPIMSGNVALRRALTSANRRGAVKRPTVCDVVSRERGGTSAARLHAVQRRHQHQGTMPPLAAPPWQSGSSPLLRSRFGSVRRAPRTVSCCARSPTPIATRRIDITPDTRSHSVILATARNAVLIDTIVGVCRDFPLV